jgi:hypothetical protein
VRQEWQARLLASPSTWLRARFIARKDGRIDWLETSDEFADGHVMARNSSRPCGAPPAPFGASETVSSECLRLGLADEVGYAILPILT